MNIQVIGQSLSEAILIAPFARGEADALHILSGYASAGAASRHLVDLSTHHREFSVNLAVGMTADGAVSKVGHQQFQRLAGDLFKGRFSCGYLPVECPSHAKIYVWTRAGAPACAWCSSGNYSQSALYGFRQQEVATPCSPVEAYSIVSKAMEQSVNCLDPRADALAFGKHRTRPWPNDSSGNDGDEDLSGQPRQILSLLAARTGEVGNKSGINWGQRGTRDPNEAYIHLPAKVCTSGFFPDRGTFFAVRTPDGQVLTCVRAQENGKAIETPLSNSELGVWLRKMAGVTEGSYVTTQQVKAAGLDSLEFIKISDDEYVARVVKPPTAPPA